VTQWVPCEVEGGWFASAIGVDEGAGTGHGGDVEGCAVCDDDCGAGCPAGAAVCAAVCPADADEGEF